MLRRLFALIATLTLLAGLVVGLDRLTSPHGERIAIIGDSITALGTARLNRENDGRFKLDIAATFGRRYEDQLADALTLAARHPNQVIIALGTNDALQGTSLEQTAKALITMVAMFPDADCIHLVTVNTALNQDGNQPEVQARAINDLLARTAQRQDNVDIIDFGSTLAQAARSNPPFGLTTDGVHPEDAGLAQMARAEFNAVERCGRPWRIW